MLKQWALVLVIVYLLILTLLSLINIGKIPNLNLSFADKVYHSIAYSVLTLLLYNFTISKGIKKGLVWSVSIAFVYGILIEFLQGLLTNTRVPDILDVLANSFGVIFAVIIITFYRKLKLK